MSITCMAQSLLKNLIVLIMSLLFHIKTVGKGATANMRHFLPISINALCQSTIQYIKQRHYCAYLALCFFATLSGFHALAETTSTVSYRPGSVLSSIPIYLRYMDGQWSASLTGDIKNSDTELVEIFHGNPGKVKIMTKPAPGGRNQCLTKMKDRIEFGYLECNSAFYSVNKGSAAAATLLRGVLSLGILTATDAASGNTAFTVSIDQSALDEAISESKAVELAKETRPLLEYRHMFTNANTSQQLRNFIATFEGNFDPESLVAKAKEILPSVVREEESREQDKAIMAEHRLQVRRQQDMQKKAEELTLLAFRAQLKPGDYVSTPMPCVASLCRLNGLVIEIKAPLAYVQWDNGGPVMQWVRLEKLFPFLPENTASRLNRRIVFDSDIVGAVGVK